MGTSDVEEVADDALAVVDVVDAQRAGHGPDNQAAVQHGAAPD